MGEKKLFNVVLAGEIKEGFDKNTVKSNLATLFKLPLEKAGALLNGQSMVVKGSVDTDTAAKYKVAIERAGAACRLEALPQEEPLEFDLTSESLGDNNSSRRTTKKSAPVSGEARPSRSISNQTAPAANPALWNPSALANWSLLLTPLFGSYFVTENYKAMRKDKAAKSAMEWFYIGIAIMLSPLLFSLFDRFFLLRYFGVFMLVYIAYLASWYFLSVRKQQQHILSEYGKDYERQPWGRILAIGFAGMVGWQIVLRLF